MPSAAIHICSRCRRGHGSVACRGTGRLITLGNVPQDAWDAYAAQGFDVVYLLVAMLMKVSAIPRA